MGKKALIIILSVLLVIVFAYSVIATIAITEFEAELEHEISSMESTCKTLTDRCEELYNENQLLKDGLYSETRVLDAAIGLIHSDAKGHKVDNVYIAVAPLEAMDNVNTTQIAYALEAYDEIECLIITFIGDSTASYTIRIDNKN